MLGSSFAALSCLSGDPYPFILIVRRHITIHVYGNLDFTPFFRHDFFVLLVMKIIALGIPVNPGSQ